MIKNGNSYFNDNKTVMAVHSGYTATPKPWSCQIVADRKPFCDGTLCTSDGYFERRFSTPEAAIKAGEKEISKRSVEHGQREVGYVLRTTLEVEL